MTVQACTDLDKKLTELYSSTVTVNLNQASSLAPEDFWKSMQMIAVNNKIMMNFKKAL